MDYVGWFRSGLILGFYHFVSFQINISYLDFFSLFFPLPLSEEITERAFFRPERIRSSLVMDMVPPDLVRMVCGICQKTLKRKTYFLGSILSSSEPSVVAVLVCDHVYHADCLEEKTNFEDRQDPPCPLCMGLLPKVEGSKESRA